MARSKPTQGTIVKLPSGSYRARAWLNNQRLGKTFPTYAAAAAWLNEISEQKSNGLTYNATKITVAEWLDDWYTIHKTSLKINTRDGYERTIKNHLKPTLGAIKLLDLTPPLLQKKYTDLVANGITLRPLQIAHTILHSALDHAVRLGILTRNPASLVLLPKPAANHSPDADELHVWTESQISSFLLSVAQHRNRNLYHLALATGMRRGELLGLQWDHIDWTDSAVLVKQQAVETPGGGWIFQTPKTKSGRRIIKIGAGVLNALRSQVNVANETRIITQTGIRYTWEENNLVFPAYTGKPQNGYNVSKEFDRLVKAAGLPDIRFHDIRHTAASQMLMHNIPIAWVSRILGHSTVSITLDIYAHYIPGIETAADLMDQITTPIAVDFTVSPKGK